MQENKNVIDRTDEEEMELVRFKAMDFAENYSASDFEAALARLFSISDYFNTEIIWRNWKDILIRMANTRDGLLMRRLRNNAAESCSLRGHRMRRKSDRTMANGQVQMTAICENADCFGYVQIIPDPLPNQVAVGGTAVALNCPVGPEHHYDPTKRERKSE